MLDQLAIPEFMIFGESLARLSLEDRLTLLRTKLFGWLVHLGSFYYCYFDKRYI